MKIVGPDGQEYQLVMDAEAEVIPGTLTRIRAMCSEIIDGEPVGREAIHLAMDIMEIIDE